jgi:hypothetical protein
VLFLFAQQPHGVNQNFALLRRPHQSFHADDASVIIAIGDHHQHFLAAMRFLNDVIDGRADRVAHRRAAARFDTPQGLFQSGGVVREIFLIREVEKGFVIEIDDEDRWIA